MKALRLSVNKSCVDNVRHDRKHCRLSPVEQSNKCYPSHDFIETRLSRMANTYVKNLNLELNIIL